MNGPIRLWKIAVALLFLAGAAAFATDPPKNPIAPAKIFEDPIGKYVEGKAGKAAILLIHGMGSGKDAWIAPAGSEYGAGDWYYDWPSPPPHYRVENHQTPGVGVHKVGLSDRDQAAANHNNWFDFLARQGYTVGTWSQPLPMFNDAYASAEVAFTEFLRRTGTRPVILVCHSRGGLIARKLLLDHGSQGRVKQLVTLHSPHQGSMWCEAVKEVRKAYQTLTAKDVKLPFPQIHDKLMSAVDSQMTKWMNQNFGPEYTELRPDSALITGLKAKDKALADLKYHTFGGTNTNLFKVYAWVYTPESAVPNKHVKFNLDAVPEEISVVSPMLAKFPNLEHFAEVTPGKGDILVSDAASRLPWSTHKTLSLNHAEALFSPLLQQEVLKILLP